MSHPFVRTERLLGTKNFNRLLSAHVMVVGVGGVGSYVVEALARSGVGQLTLVDFDVIETSDLNRQIMALHSTVGQNKVEVLKARIANINPGCQVHAFVEYYTKEQIAPDVNYIVDAIDSVQDKIDLILEAKKRNIPIISSMGTGNKMDPNQLKIMDISQTNTCPLAKKMRRELRAHNVFKDLRVLTSTEPPKHFEHHIPGVVASIATVPPIGGLLLAAQVINELIKGKEGEKDEKCT